MRNAASIPSIRGPLDIFLGYVVLPAVCHVSLRVGLDGDFAEMTVGHLHVLHFAAMCSPFRFVGGFLFSGSLRSEPSLNAVRYS